MAEWYVSSSAGGGGVGSSGDPWTLAQAETEINAGTIGTSDRVNVKDDGAYTIDDFTITFAGNAAGRATIQGYTDNIGDGGRPTITRSGAAGIPFFVFGNWWKIKDLILDQNNIGDSNDFGVSGGSGCGVERVTVLNSPATGFYNVASINCYALDCAVNGFWAGSAMFCIARNGEFGFRTINNIHCIGINNTSGYAPDHTISFGSIAINPTDHGWFNVRFGHQNINCVVKDIANGKTGIHFIGGNSPVFIKNTDFFNILGTKATTDSLLEDYQELDPQHSNEAANDFTRTGDNLNRLGFSKVGVQAFDYEQSIGPDGIVEDLPGESDVRNAIDYDFARLTGTYVPVCSGYPAEATVDRDLVFGDVNEFTGTRDVYFGTLTHYPLIEPQKLTNAVATYYTLPASTKTYFKKLKLHNLTGAAVNVKIWNVPDNAGVAGTAGNDNRFYNFDVPANDTIDLEEFTEPITLQDENDTIQAQAGSNDAIVIAGYGAFE